MSMYFGKIENEHDGWICRVVYKGGSFANFGGDGYSKEQAIELYKRWAQDRSDASYVQLFQMVQRKPEPIDKTKIICSGYFGDAWKRVRGANIETNHWS